MGRVCEKHVEFYEAECRWCEPAEAQREPAPGTQLWASGEADSPWAYVDVPPAQIHEVRRDGSRGARLWRSADGRMVMALAADRGQPGCFGTSFPPPCAHERQNKFTRHDGSTLFECRDCGYLSPAPTETGSIAQSTKEGD